LLCQNGLDEHLSQFPPSLALEAIQDIGTIYADFEKQQDVTLIAHKGGHEFHVPSVIGFFEQYLNDRNNVAQP